MGNVKNAIAEPATLEHAADYLACSVKTIRRMISKGELTGYRVGARMIRVDMAEIYAISRVIPTAGEGA